MWLNRTTISTNDAANTQFIGLDSFSIYSHSCSSLEQRAVLRMDRENVDETFHVVFLKVKVLRFWHSSSASGNLFKPYAHRSGVFACVSPRIGHDTIKWHSQFVIQHAQFFLVRSTPAFACTHSARVRRMYDWYHFHGDCVMCAENMYKTVNSSAPILLLFIFGKSTTRLMMLFSLTISLNKCICVFERCVILAPNRFIDFGKI